MGAANVLPEKMTDFNVYDANSKLVGITDEITLPNLETMTETISGAGIAGEFDSPTIGHFGALTLELPFRTLTDKNFSLFDERARIIYLRGSVQHYDASEGIRKNTPVKVTVKGTPKGLDLGKFGKGKAMESKNTIEVMYIKVEIDNKEVLELDKINYIFKVNGEDKLESIRDQI